MPLTRVRNLCDKLNVTMDISNIESVGADVTVSEHVKMPNWLSVPDPAPPKRSAPARQLALTQFEAVFPRVMDMVASGYDLTKALDDLQLTLDYGAFNRWVKKDPMRHEQLKDAQELRSEVWADKMMRHAMGDYEMEDVNRSKLVVDTYKWRIAADNRRKYGATTQVEFGGSISVITALEDAQRRVLANVIDITPTESED